MNYAGEEQRQTDQVNWERKASIRDSPVSSVLTCDAILFDIDGTLVDSTAAVERSWTTWARRRGIEPRSVLDVCHGRRASDTIALFVADSERRRAVAEHARLELDDMDGVVALSGARELLAALPLNRWAAVTSGSRDLMTRRLQRAGLPVPGIMIAAEDVAVGKPDPTGYQQAAVDLHVESAQCLVIEDAPAGIEAGRSAGGKVLAVATTHDASLLTRADVIVSGLDSCHVASVAEALVLTLQFPIR